MWVKRTGFTIVELLIVITVIAILASITVVAFNGVQQRARAVKQTTDVRNIESTLRVSQVESGGNYPANGDTTFLTSLGQMGVKDPRDNGATTNRIGTTSFCDSGAPWFNKSVSGCRGYGYLTFGAGGQGQAYGHSAGQSGCTITAISNNPSYVISWYDEATNMIKFKVSSTTDVSVTTNQSSTTFPTQICTAT